MLYRSTSRAILDAAPSVDGVVTIQVIEGGVERIEVKGTRRLNPDYVVRRVQLGTGTPLNAAHLEDQLRLLRADPLFKNVEASLRAGEKLGQMDINLPEIDGLALTQQLRSHNHWHNIPIIVQTAMAMLSDREACFNDGTTDYITKPLDLRQLAGMIVRYLGQDKP